MSLISKIESLLFVESKPISIRELVKILEIEEQEVRDSLEILKKQYQNPDSGLQIIDNGLEVRLTTKAENFEFLQKVAATEFSDELTKPQLETLTLIGYLGPLTKVEIEEIRGINCGLILKNLLMRDLICEEESKENLLPVYILSTTALAYLGISAPSDLPDYENLRNHENLKKVIEETFSKTE